VKSEKLVVSSQREKQIPSGNDSQKSKGNSGSFVALRMTNLAGMTDRKAKTTAKTRA